jgi:hypothetical protein
MQGRWRMSELKYNHNDERVDRDVVWSILHKNVSSYLTPKSNQPFRQLCAVLIQFQKYIQKQMLSQGALWSLWTDNRIKSRIS